MNKPTSMKSSLIRAWTTDAVSKASFTEAITKALFEHYIEGLVLDPPPTLEILTPKALESYKNAARRALDNEAIRGEAMRIIEAAKSDLALKSVTDFERAYNRGVVQGIRLLETALRNLSAGKE